MTYTTAARYADQAMSKARSASLYYKESGDQDLAEAVALLARAVSELAHSTNRDAP